MMTLEDYKTYIYIIYFIAFVFALLVALKTDLKGYNTPNNLNLILVFIFCISFLFLFGNRSIHVGTDTQAMIIGFNNALYSDNRDPVFKIIQIFFSKFTNAQGFLFFLAFLYLGNIYLFVKNQSYRINKYLFFYFFICMSFFEPLGINVVRQGVSLVFFLNAITFYNAKKYRWMFLFLFFSFSFHTTALISISLFIASVILSKQKNFYLALSIFIICSIISILNINVFTLIPKVTGFDALDVRASGYLADDTFGYTVGFRPTFFVFNLFFVFISFYTYKYIQKIGDTEDINRSKVYINYYLLTSSVFFLAFSIPFSDRWGLFSWIIIPLFFIPFFKRGFKKYALVSVVFCTLILILFQFVIK